MVSFALLHRPRLFRVNVWDELTTLNVLDGRTRGFSGLAGPSQRLGTPALEVGVAFDYRHTWFIPEAWERSSRYWWLSITVSIPEVFLFFPDVLSNGIVLDATEPADNPVLEALQNINPINHVVQAVYSIPRKSTLGVSPGNSWCPWSGYVTGIGLRVRMPSEFYWCYVDDVFD